MRQALILYRLTSHREEKADIERCGEVLGALPLFDALPNAKELLGENGSNGDRFRTALNARRINPCISPKSDHKDQHHYDMSTYKKRRLV